MVATPIKPTEPSKPITAPDVTIDPESIDIKAFPSSTAPKLIDWVNAIANQLWLPHHRAITKFFEQECPKYRDVIFGLKAKGVNNFAFKEGWSRLDPKFGFVSIDPNELPLVMSLDFEAVRRDEDSPYLPFLAFAFGDGCYHVWRRGSEAVKVAQFPPNRVIIAQNGVSYDRRLLSCEYDQENFFHPSTIWIDTFCLATMVSGLSRQQETAYKGAMANKAEGKGVPAWTEQACERDLASLAHFYCGIEITKTVRSEEIEKRFERDFNFNDLPTSVVEYCAQDVWSTFYVARRLFFIVDKKFFTSPVSWWGVQELSQSRFHLKDYSQFLQTSERDYQKVKAEISSQVEHLAKSELARGKDIITRFVYKKLGKVETIRAEILALAQKLDPELFSPVDEPENAFVNLLYHVGFEPSEKQEVITFTYKSLSYKPAEIKYGQGWKTALSKGGEKLKCKCITFLTKRINSDISVYKKQLNKATPGELNETGLDWSRLSSGNNAGRIKWFVELQKKDFSLNRDAIRLFDFFWEGHPIQWESIKTEKGSSGFWSANNEPLPHPDGAGKNLDSPLCKNYWDHIVSEKLMSNQLSKKELMSFHSKVTLISQWTSFRERLNDVYRLPTSQEGLELTTGDIAPIGTVSRRVKSKIWQVSPKPSEKIGSGLMNHLSVPDGFTIIGTDVDQQESRMAAIIGDAAKGKIGSNPWSQAIIQGNKDAGTDDHSLTASQLSVPRKAAKGLNFALAYRAGLSKLANTLSIALSIPFIDSLPIAAKFLYYKLGQDYVFKQLCKFLEGYGLSSADALALVLITQDEYDGPVGVQRETIETLAKYADTPSIRTAVLNVLIPNTLNTNFIGDQFFTTRNNWQVQSPSVDFLHVLLTLVRAFCMEYDVRFWFIFAVHDSIFFAVENGKTDVFKSILQRAHQLTWMLVYEQALAHARNVPPKSNKTEGPLDFKCPEAQYWFSEIKLGQTVAEAV